MRFLKFITLICFLLSGWWSIAQNRWISFQVLDREDGQPLEHALVIDPATRQVVTQSNHEGKLALIYESKKYTVHLFGYEETVLDLSHYRSEYQIVKIYLKSIPEVLESVELKVKPFWQRDRIKAFEFWEGGILALKRYEHKAVVYNYDLRKKSEHDLKQIDGEKVRELYSDVQGNLFLISKSKVQQVYVSNNGIFYYKPRSIEEFNRYIKDLKIVFEDGSSIYRNNAPELFDHQISRLDSGYSVNVNLQLPRLHNCGSEFVLYDGVHLPKPIYYAVDTNKWFAAQQQFRLFMGLYVQAEGRVTDRSWGMAQHTYKKLYAAYQDIPMFKYEDKVIVFDAITNRMVKLNRQFETDTILKYDFSKSSRSSVAFQDAVNDRIWMFERKRGVDMIYELEDGISPTSFKHRIGVFTRNVRIAKNVVYYMDEDNHLTFYHIPDPFSSN